MELISSHPEASQNYLELRQRARRALEATDFAKASKYFEWAYQEARQSGESELVERAFCNLAVPALELDSADRYLDGLKDIATTSSAAGNRFLASHILTQAFNGKREYKSGALYAALAHQNAARLESPYEQAVSSFTLGVQACIEGRHLAAQRFLEEAVRLGSDVWPANLRALAKSTLGYCMGALGQSFRAYPLMQESVNDLSLLSCRVYENCARLNFGFTLIGMAEFETALEQADSVLRSDSAPMQRKNALYLAGEASSHLEEDDLAKEYYSVLQQEFYPQLPWLLDALPSMRTHRLVNWFA